MGAQRRFPGEARRGAFRPKSGPAVAALFLSWSLLFVAPLRGQAPFAENSKGFAPNATFQTNGFDHVNLFSGNLALSIPLGPTYPIGADFSHRLNLVYNSKLWRSELGCTYQGNDYYGIYVSGSPVTGAGWTLELGHLNQHEPFSETGNGAIAFRYLGSDGSAHNFHSCAPLAPYCTSDTSFLRAANLLIDPQTNVLMSAEIDFPDGEKGYFTKQINKQMVNHGPTPHDFDADGLYLTKLKSRFGDTILVTYGPNPVADGSTQISTVQHYRGDPDTAGQLVRTISFSYRQITVTAGSSSATWSVLDRIELPSPVNGQPQKVTFDYLLTGFARPGGDHVGSVCPAFRSNTPVVPLLKTVQIDTMKPELTYQFAYNQSFTAGYETDSGLLNQVTMPTGGVIQYQWSPQLETGDSAFSTCPPPANIPIVSCPQGDRSCLRQWQVRTAGIAARSEYPYSTGLAGGSANTWLYTRARCILAPNGTSNYEVGGVVGPDGYRANHYFHIENSDFADLPGNGLEYQADVLGSVGTRARTTAYCYDGEGASGTVLNICGGVGNNVFSNVRESSETVSTIALSGGAVVQSKSVRRSNWDGFGHFLHVGVFDWGGSTALRTIDRIYGVSSANTSPAPNDPATFRANWLLFPLLSEKVSEAGQSMQTTQTYNSSNGFLLSTTVDDSLMQGCAGAGCGSRTTENFRSAGSGMDGRTYTKTNTFQNGLLTSSQWSGASWKAADRTIDLATGLVTSSRDPAGLQTSTAYDILGRPISVTPPGEASTLICYDSATQATIYRDTAAMPTCPASSTAGLTWEQYLYDGFGRLVREIRRTPTATGFSVRTHRFDTTGREVFVSEWGSCDSVTTTCLTASPFGTTTSNFDPLGRHGKLQKADLSEISIDYTDGSAQASDTQKKVTVCVNAMNPGGSCLVPGISASTFYRYDGLGRLTRVNEHDGSVTDYQYNVLDKLSQVTQAGPGATQTRIFRYDAFGFLRSESTPEKGAVSYGKYDSLGNLVESTEPNGFTLTRAYNTAWQLVSITSSESGGRTFLSNAYDAFGRLSQSTSNNYTAKRGTHVVSERFAFSPTTGRLIRKTSSYPGLPADSFETDWTYTPLGLVNDMSHLASGMLMGKVTYSYGNGYPIGVQGQPKGLGNTPLITGASYNPSGGLASYTFGNSNGPATTTITPDISLLPRPSQIAVSGGRWSSGLYSYDAAGNIKGIGSDTYHYDGMSRIDGATIGGTSHTFAYDRWGNLTRKGPTSTPQTFAIDATRNQIQPSSIVSYDAFGNLTRYGSSAFFYDTLSRQTDWGDLSSGAQETYVYSTAGERVGRVGVFPASPPPTITSSSALKMCPSQTPTYMTTLQAAGGFQPYTWSAAGLLSWMSLSSAGVFSATPPAGLTLPQTLSFAVTVTDASSQSISKPFALTVGSCPPFWIAEPQDTILCPGGAYTTGVRARDPNAPLNGPDGVTYVWQRLSSDGVSWVQVSTTVSANEVPPATVNYYRAIATATANGISITSRVARVSVGEPIKILRSDTAYFYCRTNPPPAVDLSWFIDAIGGNLQIVWQKQNTDTTWSDLTSTLVTPTQTTFYRARLSSSCSPTVYGNALSIVVFTPLTYTQTPSSQSFCPNGSVTVSETTNVMAYVKWQRYDTATASWVTMQDSATQGLQKTSDSLTLTPSGTTQYKVIVSNYCGAVESSFVLTQTPLPSVSGMPANPQVCVPGVTTFTPSVSNATSLQWQSSPNGTTWANVAGATSATYTTPTLPTGYSYYRLAATNSCGTTYGSSIVTGNPIPHAQITGPCSITSGETVTLTASSDVSGSGFSWDHGLGMGASVQVHPTTTTTYSCTVQTSQGCATVAQYTVAVGTHVDPPVINGQPLANTIVCAGMTGTLAVIATGTNLAYQWQQLSGSTWGNVSGATSSTLSVGATNATYRVIVSNACGSVTSNQAAVTASSATPATITTSPQSTFVCSGSSTTLSVAASGTGPLSYAWQKSTDQTNWTNVSGSTSSLTDSPTVRTYYRVYVGNICRQVVSNTAVITPVSAITVTQQPIGSGAACGSWTMTAATSAAGAGYQWQVLSGSWSNIAGATSNSYAATATGTYRCMLSNACGSVASNQAAVTIVPPPPAPSITGNSFIYAGDTAYLWIANDAYPSDTISWSNGVLGPHTIAVRPTVTTTYYANRYRNGCWSTWGPGFTVTVGAGGASYLGYYETAKSSVSLAYGSADRKNAKEIALNKKRSATVFAGDWDGDGVASVGVYDPDTGTFTLWNDEPKGKPNYELQVAGLSGPSLQPVVGDWDGDGIDTVGLYSASTGEVRLRNKNSNGSADEVYRFALPFQDGIAVAGDWLGQGYDTIGVYETHGSVFYLRDSHTTGGADHAVAFEAWKQGLLPLAGDWNWTQMSKLGLYDPETGEVRLRITLESGPPDYVKKVSDHAYDVQVFAGRWNAPKHATGGRKKASAGTVDRESRSFGGSDGGAGNSAGEPVSGKTPRPSVSVRKEVAGLPAGLTWHYTIRDEANRPSIQCHLDPSGNLVLDRIHAYLGSLHIATYEALVLEPQWHCYASDHLGSARLVMDSGGTVLSKPTYLPFGEQIGSDPPGVNPSLKFAAMERDEVKSGSSGNDYDHARYISSVTGRFLAPDKVGGKRDYPGSWNRYVYSRNNPLRFVDPDGNVSALAWGLAYQDPRVAAAADAAPGQIARMVGGTSAVVGAGTAAILAGAGGWRALGQFLMRYPWLALGAMQVGNAMVDGPTPPRIVLGETMRRVDAAAKVLEAGTFDVSWTTKADVMAKNLTWLKKAVDSGTRILDIGLDAARKVGSDFYAKEVEFLQSQGFVRHLLGKMDIAGKETLVYEWAKEVK